MNPKSKLHLIALQIEGRKIMSTVIKIALAFIGGMTVGSYGVVNAAFKSQTFTAALKDAIKRKTVEVIYGEESRSTRRRVSYYDIYHNDPKTSKCKLSHCGDIIFQTRQDAENTLDSLKEMIELYGFISLADVCDLVGITPSYTDNKYGWRSLNNAKVVRSRYGYFIEVPKAVEI